ncbi:BRO1-domain-containing protein [Dacryopinax primogenitus]|uniref:BRO1-domain-containing protein n=1 Tax=Dacryopinax primogenitus (strain DJM 731) TaxID=1858805 RepID=M5G7Z2_DACPD|nr:BRO1-domain-containing protein [Dacryopinax primogenitus]EJU04879.1 BRO1-domain-containing protein [Dacryopinax primogenitus]
MPPAHINQLVIPPKSSTPVSFAENIRAYINENLPTHADAFRTDIEALDRLRSNALTGIEQQASQKIEALQTYLLHLLLLIKRLPPSTPPRLPYSPPFPPASFALTAPLPPAESNFHWEICNVMWNLGAAWSARAGEEGRKTSEALGRAKRAFESAAGLYRTLRTDQLPALQEALGKTKPLPIDLTESWLEVAERLMLVQAQECFWQAAVAGGNMKNVTIAKLALAVAELYESVNQAMFVASPPISDSFPTAWLSHIEVKRSHFFAAAQFRQASADGEAHKYGDEIARLHLAAALVKKGSAEAKRGVSQLVTNDIASLSKAINESTSRAERDNDLIYHQDVPAASSLPPIQARNVTAPAPIDGWKDPRRVLGSMLFEQLMPWAVTRAILIYQERKKEWLEDQIVLKDEELEQTATRTLQELNLPAALDALERPTGLPPSLLGKAEEVRKAGGVKRVQALFADVVKLGGSNSKLLDDAYDILDLEASEDEGLRASGLPVDRPLSQEANADLIEQASRYSKLMQQARESDEQVLAKWEEWEEIIEKLEQDEDALEEYVPSVGAGSQRDSSQYQPMVHVRQLRILLESLDDLKENRRRLRSQARHSIATDPNGETDIVHKAELLGMDNLEPEMFEDLIQSLMSKLEVWSDKMNDQAELLSGRLDEIREENLLFEELTLNDPVMKERERALQELDVAYHRYSEVLGNLTEGLNFYNGMAQYLNDLRENCKAWARDRRAEAEHLRSLQHQPAPAPSAPAALVPPASPTFRSIRTQQADLVASPSAADTRRSSYGLPASNSQSWSDGSPPSHPSSNIRVLSLAPDLPPPDSLEWQELPPLQPPTSSTKSKGKGGPRKGY